MKFMAILLNTEPDLQGEIFSREALEAMVAGTAEEVPLSIDFAHRVGVARRFRMRGDEVVCDVEFDKTINDTVAVLVAPYPAAGIMTDLETGASAIYEVGLTDMPAVAAARLERVE